jgi:hypothetical protein
MTVQEKRTELKNYADTLDPEMIDRVYNFVIKINDSEANHDKIRDDDFFSTVKGNRVSHENLMKAIDDIGTKYDSDLRKLSQ